MSSCYVFANVKVTDPVQYEEYRKWSSLAMKNHGAEVCVRGGEVEVIEGDWTPDRVVILKFPSKAAAQTFYNSSEYTEARKARANACIMRMVMIEGV